MGKVGYVSAGKSLRLFSMHFAVTKSVILKYMYLYSMRHVIFLLKYKKERNIHTYIRRNSGSNFPFHTDQGNVLILFLKVLFLQK